MTDPRPPSLTDALIPVVSLIGMLGLSVYLFGSDSSYGPNQIVLIIGAAIACGIAIKNGYRWATLLQAIIDGISTAMGAILILIAVGALIGTWLMSGTVPTLILYGVEILNPSFFYAATCIICAVAALATGSSWTVAGTLGVALIGVAIGLDLNPAIAAGAIISGAYFGDKMSPLSDTTNLAPAVVGTDVFTHIRHMTWTTLPSITIALVLFTLVGFGTESMADTTSLDTLKRVLNDNFNISAVTLLPLAVVFFMAYKKVPPLPTILFGAFLGGILAVITQAEVVLAYANSPELPNALALTKGVWLALASGYTSTTGAADVDSLLSRGGMASMLNTVWLILCALSYGAVIEHTGILARLIESALRAAKTTGTLVMTVVFSTIGINVLAADQYIAIVLPGKMYKAEFDRRGLAPKNLSRIVEDSGTITSPLVPWNTCGVYMAATLGVATFAYLPFAFFNLINPLVSIFYGFTGFSIEKLDEEGPGDLPAREA